MTERKVASTRKDGDGDILALCNPASYWSPRSKRDAIRDIESGTHKYYVPWRSSRTYIHVVNGPNGKYLRTNQDDSSRNNLDDLPDC